MLRIALTKGRIEKKAVAMLSAAGYDCSELDENNKGRKLLFCVGDSIEIVLAKAADVVTYVEHGVCDAGVVGEDTIMEHGKQLFELLDLNFGVCRFALAGKKGCSFFDGLGHKTVATKYPEVTRQYLASKGIDAEIVKIEGSVELAPLLGLSDAIVDIVETGKTLEANGLTVYEEICRISARFIVNIASAKLKKDALDPLLAKLESQC